jgi:predicted ester cyclase
MSSSGDQKAPELPEPIQVVVDEMVKAMLSNDSGTVLELYSDDCEVSDPAMSLTGKEGLRQAVDYFFAAFRITRFEAEVALWQDPYLVIRSNWEVLHQGEYLGVPPSGKTMATWNVMWLTLREGKIIGDNSIWDAGELRRLEALAAN